MIMTFLSNCDQSDWKKQSHHMYVDAILNEYDSSTTISDARLSDRNARAIMILSSQLCRTLRSDF